MTFSNMTHVKQYICENVPSIYLFSGSSNLVPAKSKTVRDLIRKISMQAELLLPKIEDVKAEQMGDLVDQEMAQTMKAIQNASARIAVGFNYSISVVCFT